MEEDDKYEGVVSGNGGEAAGNGTEAPVDELQALKEERDGLYDRLIR
jgi:hypothetical protein